MSDGFDDPFQPPPLPAGVTEADIAAAAPADGESGMKVRRLRRQALVDVEPRSVKWIVKGLIPSRTLTLVAGVGGLGKSTWLLGKAADLTNGLLACDAADVILVTFEDTAEEVLRPRVQAAEGNLERVHVVTVETEQIELLVCLPRDVAELERQITETGARLVVIDPIVAALDVTLDAHKDQHVRLALGQLARLAEDTDCAICIVGHLNKTPSTDAYIRVANSVAFWNAARSVVLITEDPDDPDTGRLIAQRKANYARMRPVERHRIEEIQLDDLDPDTGDPIVTSRMVFVELADDVDGAEVLHHRPPTDTKEAQSVAFVARALMDGEWRESSMVKAEAADAGHSERTVQRAIRSLSVEVKNEGFPRQTFWRLLSRATVTPKEDGATERGTANPHDTMDSGGNRNTVAPVAPVAPRGDRDGPSGFPILGDEMYPVVLAHAADNGHITEDEYDQALALHRLIDRARAAGYGEEEPSA